MFTTEQANNCATWFDCVRLKVSERLYLRLFSPRQNHCRKKVRYAVAGIGYMLYMIHKLLLQFRLQRVHVHRLIARSSLSACNNSITPAFKHTLINATYTSWKSVC